MPPFDREDNRAEVQRDQAKRKKKIRVKRKPVPVRVADSPDYVRRKPEVEKQFKADRRSETKPKRVGRGVRGKLKSGGGNGPFDEILDSIWDLAVAGSVHGPTMGGPVGGGLPMRRTKEQRERVLKKSVGSNPFLKDWILGPNLTEWTTGEGDFNTWAGAEMALLLPFLKPIAGSRAGIVAGKTALSKGGKEALKAGAKEYAGPGLTRRVMRSAIEPAARSRIGRAGERLVDKARPVTGKLPGVRSPEQKLGNELKINEKFEKKLDAAYGTQLKAVGKKLSTTEQYAIRLIGEGVDPQTQIQLHKTLAEGFTGTEKASHLIHAEAYRQAARYVESDGAGLVLKADAPDRLKQAVELMQQSGAQREGIYVALGIKTPETLAARIQKPGQLITGKRGDSQAGYHYNQFGLKSKNEWAHSAREQVHNIYDEYDNLIGSMVYDARPERKSVYVESIFIRPEFRDSNNLRRLVEPLLKESRHIEADVQNPRLERLIERLTDRGVVKGKVLPKSSERTIQRADVTDEPLPDLYRGFKGGKFYVPDKRGLPVSWRKPWRQVNSHIRYASSFLGGGKTIGRGAAIPANLKKEYQGLLKGSGLFKGNVTDATAEQTFKAVRLASAKRIRESLLEVSTELPQKVDDIAIKVDPTKDASPELRRLFDLMQDMELQANKVSMKKLDEINIDLFKQLQDTIFPPEGKHLALELVNTAAATPIDNIRWVSRQVIESSEFMANPQTIVAQQEAWGKFELVGKGTDLYNDYVKASILQFNPQYYTANFLGNIALNVMQQGPLALVNLPRAAFLSHELGEGLAAVIDDLMGSGLTPLSDFKFGAKVPLNVLNNVATKLVDTIPRRAAFLHEARKLGYKSAADIEQLLKKGLHEGDKEARKDIIYLSRRGRDAIIDYERMNPFEKKVITRVLFIYPWIKGSTRFMLRFPAEHPVQAAAFAILYERQQSMADQELGERPWYADLNIPTGMTVERYGEEYPLTVNPKQLVPFTQQYELGRTAEGFIRGIENRQPLIDTASPLIGNLATALTGKRAFDDRDVDRDAGTFLSETFAIPWRDRWKALTQSDEEREENAGNRLYPRNFTDELLKAGLGTLAPTPYNREKGERLARGQKGPTKAQEWGEKMEALQEAYPGWTPAPALKQKIDEAIAYKDVWEEIRTKNPKGDDQSDDEREEELATLKLDMLLKVKPEYQSYRDRFKEAIRIKPSRVEARIDKLLGWDVLEKISELLNAAETKRRIQAEQHSG